MRVGFGGLTRVEEPTPEHWEQIHRSCLTGPFDDLDWIRGAVDTGHASLWEWSGPKGTGLVVLQIQPRGPERFALHICHVVGNGILADDGGGFAEALDRIAVLCGCDTIDALVHVKLATSDAGRAWCEALGIETTHHRFEKPVRIHVQG